MRAQFLQWARASVIPITELCGKATLNAMARVVGDARLVALGEGEHLISEPLELRNKLFEHLVEQKNFSAIAIESGTVESRWVHDYVLGSEEKFDEVLRNGLSWTAEELPQNRSLIEWMRAYNARTQRQICCYGFDVPGSPGNPRAGRGVDTALRELLRYMERVDRLLAQSIGSRITHLLPFIRFNPYPGAEDHGYQALDQAQRDTITGAITDLSNALLCHEDEYIRASSANDFEWAKLSAAGAQQADGWLRCIPFDWRASAEQMPLLNLASDLRDKAQADNVEWISRREGCNAKILLYAHQYHLATSRIRRSWLAAGATIPDGTHDRPVAGTYLRARYGRELITIGHLIGDGVLGVREKHRRLNTPSSESIDSLFRDIGVANFLLDLRTLPQALAPWLNELRELGRGYAAYERYEVRSQTRFLEAFDAILFTGAVTPIV